MFVYFRFSSVRVFCTNLPDCFDQPANVSERTILTLHVVMQLFKVNKAALSVHHLSDQRLDCQAKPFSNWPAQESFWLIWGNHCQCIMQYVNCLVDLIVLMLTLADVLTGPWLMLIFLFLCISIRCSGAYHTNNSLLIKRIWKLLGGLSFQVCGCVQ